MVTRACFVFVIAAFCLAQCELINLSCEQVQYLVDGHNYRRLSLARGEVISQPAATNMKYMIWDEELASKASQWALNGEFGHNPDKTIGSGRFKTGENLYMFETTEDVKTFDIEKALDSWFNEYHDYEFGPLTSHDFDDKNKQIGHYTQMAWADTTYIGCGLTRRFSDYTTTFFLVCNYGPPGNYIGETPYETNGGQTPMDYLECVTDDCSKLYGDRC